MQRICTRTNFLVSCCTRFCTYSYCAPARGKGGSKRWFCPSVCLSVRPSRTQRITGEPEGLRAQIRNEGSTLLKRLAYQFQGQKVKGQRSRSPGPLMLTHTLLHIFRTARPTNFNLGTRMEDDESTTRVSHRRHDLQGQRSRS